MHARTEQRVVAFVRSVADKCTTCMRRSEETCRNCVSMWANSVLIDIEADRDGKSKHIDYSLGARSERIMTALMRANRPLFSSEIDLGGICSMQLKYWTLKKMCKLKKIVRKAYRTGPSNRKVYLYSLPNKGTSK